MDLLVASPALIRTFVRMEGVGPTSLTNAGVIAPMIGRETLIAASLPAFLTL